MRLEACGGWRWRFEVEDLDESCVRESADSCRQWRLRKGFFDKIKMLPKLAELGSFFPKSVKSGACKEVIEKGTDVNLFDFPILKCWPQDGGAVHHISFGVYEESGDRKAKCRDVPHAGLRRADDGDALADAEARGGTFPRGESEESRRQDSCERGDWRRPGDGASGDAADSSGPRRDDVCRAFCGASPWRWCPARLTIWKCLQTPRSWLEGHVNLNELRTEGPFGDTRVFTRWKGEYPVFHVECVTRRKDRST